MLDHVQLQCLSHLLVFKSQISVDILPAWDNLIHARKSDIFIMCTCSSKCMQAHSRAAHTGLQQISYTKGTITAANLTGHWYPYWLSLVY